MNALELALRRISSRPTPLVPHPSGSAIHGSLQSEAKRCAHNLRAILKTAAAGSLASLGLSVNAHADLVIGRLGSLKNSVTSSVTAEVAQGCDVYFMKLNASGGINGQSITVKFRDDDFDAGKVVAETKRFIEKDHVLAVMSPMGSMGSEALIKENVLVKAGIALVGPISGSDQVQAGANVFTLRASYRAEFAAAVKQMQVLGQKRVAYFNYNLALGPALASEFAKVVEDSGLTFVGAVGFDVTKEAAQQATVLQTAVVKLAALRPDAVYILAAGPTFPQAVRYVTGQLGEGVAKYTFSLNSWDLMVSQLGIKQSRGMIFSQAVPYPYNNARAISREYQRDMKQFAPTAKLTFASLEGYMTGKVIAEGLRRAGANPTNRTMLGALERLGRFDLGDYILNYSTVSRKVDATVEMTTVNSEGKLLK